MEGSHELPRSPLEPFFEYELWQDKYSKQVQEEANQSLYPKNDRLANWWFHGFSETLLGGPSQGVSAWDPPQKITYSLSQPIHQGRTSMMQDHRQAQYGTMNDSFIHYPPLPAHSTVPDMRSTNDQALGTTYNATHCLATMRHPGRSVPIAVQSPSTGPQSHVPPSQSLGSNWPGSRPIVKQPTILPSNTCVTTQSAATLPGPDSLSTRTASRLVIPLKTTSSVSVPASSPCLLKSRIRRRNPHPCQSWPSFRCISHSRKYRPYGKDHSAYLFDVVDGEFKPDPDGLVALARLHQTNISNWASYRLGITLLRMNGPDGATTSADNWISRVKADRRREAREEHCSTMLITWYKEILETIKARWPDCLETLSYMTIQMINNSRDDQEIATDVAKLLTWDALKCFLNKSAQRAMRQPGRRISPITWGRNRRWGATVEYNL